MYVSFFEAYETLSVDMLTTPCMSFEEISDEQYKKPKEVTVLERMITNSIQYRQGRDVMPFVLRWFECCQEYTPQFQIIVPEAIQLYGNIKRVIFDHYELKPTRIKRGLEIFEVINIQTIDELRNWFIVWLDYTLTDFMKISSGAPVFSVEEAHRFIDKHLCEDCSLTNLAEYFNRTSPYISMLFKQQSGQTFQHYVAEQKMKKASELLSEYKSIRECAHKLGYTDEKYFRSLFKHYWKMSPREYKERKQRKE